LLICSSFIILVNHFSTIQIIDVKLCIDLGFNMWKMSLPDNQ
jgi:hypothetical protein